MIACAVCHEELRALHFEIYRVSDTEAAESPGKPWKWRLIALDGLAVAYGEGYASRKDCARAITTVMGASPQTPVRYR